MKLKNLSSLHSNEMLLTYRSIQANNLARLNTQKLMLLCTSCTVVAAMLQEYIPSIPQPREKAEEIVVRWEKLDFK